VNNKVSSSYSKEELLNIVKQYFSDEPRPISNDEVIEFLEAELCKFVNSMIDIKRKDLNNLSFIDKTKTVAIFNGPLTKSCNICLTSGMIPLRTSTRCNLQCDFCYEANLDTVPLVKNQVIFNNLKLELEPFKVFLNKQSHLYEGIAWVSRGEPLTELDKIKELMPFISNLGIYQWMNTNGLLLNEDILKLLVDCGLNELRINLQASNFSREMISKLKLCKKYFDQLVIESPMFSLSFENFIKHTPVLIDYGVVQMNIPELQVFPNTIDRFYESEGIFYKHNRGYVSPVSSILFIYDYLKICEDKNWNITINPCTNSTKFYRGCNTNLRGVIDYNIHIKILPITSYLFIIDKYFSNSENDRWEIF
jgi:pyruvate formate-lyase activating enzyme-like uncharacterized protein